MQCQAPSGYAREILEATGAPSTLLATLENIMRDEVFHSTLDWQSAKEFRAGARRAYQIYCENAAFYDADRRYRQASYHSLAASEALLEMRDAGTPAQIFEAEDQIELALVEEAAARAELDKQLALL